MHLVRTICLATPTCIVERFGQKIITAQTTRAMYLHAAIDDALHHQRHAGLAGRDHIARSLGTHLIQETMDTVEFVEPPPDCGNLLKMIKRIDAKAAAAERPAR